MKVYRPRVASEAKQRLGVRASLVRPDGFIAWASDLAAGEGDAGKAALRWFGGRP